MRRIIISAAASVCLSSMLGPCFAQTPAAAMSRIETRIPPQALGSALQQFAKLRHIQVLYFTGDVKDLRTAGASGELTAGETLTRLLTGTRLKYRYVDTNAISILAAAQPGGGVAHKTSPHVDGGHQLRIPQENKAALVSKNTDPPGPEEVPTDIRKSHRKPALQEIVITGSRLPAMSRYGPQEMRIYDGQIIEQSGQSSVAAFLSTIPSVSVTSPVFLSTSYDSSTVRLRGLPVGTTLVLLNGRRVENSAAASGSYFDLSNIPLAAIQRIEVDENGSSAVYGSDAIAGVVNIILKKDFNGFAADARYDSAKDIRNVRSSVEFGKQWERGGFSVVGTYDMDGGLLSTERELTASNDYSRYGGPDNNLPVCFPGNVFSLDGQPLPGGPPGGAATYAAVAGSAASGKPALSQFSYGTLNQCAEMGQISLVPSIQREGALVEAHLDISPGLSAFSEVMYTHVDQVAREGDDVLFGMPGYLLFTVPANNPFNPFGEAVGVAEDIPTLPISEDVNTDFFRPLIGVKGVFASAWHWEISAWESVDWTRAFTTNDFENITALQNALDSSNRTAALNPFVNGPLGSQAVLAATSSDRTESLMGRDRSAEGFIRGPMAHLPAGELLTVFGVDYVRSKLYTASNGGTGVFSIYNRVANNQRRYSAVFGEVRIPLVPCYSNCRSGALVSTTISGRHDDYSDFGGDTTYQIGVGVRPFDGFLISGTYGTAFSAPSLPLLYAQQFVNQFGLIKNPATGKLETTEVISGGNPKLQPNTGQSHSIGITYVSRQVEGLLLSVTQWRVLEHDVAQAFSPQVIVNNASLFPDRVVVNSAGNIIEVNDTEANFGSIDVSGLDYKLYYKHHLGRGVGSVDLDATETYRYTQALVPGAPAVSSLSKAEDDANWAPRWKATAGIGWASELLECHFDGRYTGSYQDYDSTRRIGNFWIVDANVKLAIGKLLDAHNRYLSGAYLELGATNLLNTGPQFSNYFTDLVGYDAAQMNIVGRSVYVGAGMRW